MNIKSRIRRIEDATAFKQPEETKLCEHPASAIHFYRVNAVTGWREQRAVEKFICHGCGYQELLLKRFDLNEEDALVFLTADFWERREIELELLEAGLIEYTYYPASEEEKQNAVKWTALNRANDRRVRAFMQWAFGDKK